MQLELLERNPMTQTPPLALVKTWYHLLSSSEDNDVKAAKKPKLKLNKTHKFSQKATITPNKALFQSGPIDYNDALTKSFQMLHLNAVNSYEEDSST